MDNRYNFATVDEFTYHWNHCAYNPFGPTTMQTKKSLKKRFIYSTKIRHLVTLWIWCHFIVWELVPLHVTLSLGFSVLDFRPFCFYKPVSPRLPSPVLSLALWCELYSALEFTFIKLKICCLFVWIFVMQARFFRDRVRETWKIN